MRFLVFLFLTLFSFVSASAQTVHLVRIADVYGEGIGENVKNDAINFLDVMKQNIAPGEFVDHPFDWEHNNRRDKILAFLRNLPNVRRNDTVVFYYSGHGLHDQEQGQYYPLTLPGVTDNALFKKDVLAAAESHQPHLVVMISDCCSQVMRIDRLKELEREVAGRKGIAQGIATQPLFRQLFFEAKGLVDFQAAQIDESALAVLHNGKPGSIMTNVMCDSLKKHRSEALDWKTFFPVVQQKTLQESSEIEIAESKGKAKGSEGGEIKRHTPKAYALGVSFGAAVAEVNGVVAVARLLNSYPAIEGGLQVNDVILDINGVPIRSKQNYTDAVDAAGRFLRIKIQRGSEVSEIKIDLQN